MNRPIAASVALASLGTVNACPGSSSFIHAKAQMTTTFASDSCDVVRDEIKARIAGANGWVDPHNGGKYSLLSESADGKLTVQRVTGNKKYTDKMDFSFAAKGSGCELQGCSESQVTSVADFSTNFCNLHDLYCGSADGCPIASKDLSYTESASTSVGASKDKSACVVRQQEQEVVVLASLGTVDACPGSASFIHAKAQVTTTFASDSCDVVRDEIKARIAGANGWVDPHNGGTYSLLSESADGKLTVQRVTGNKKYTDKMGFSFSAKGSGCELQGCSESQVTSVADFSTNFCNLHDLYCGSADGCPTASKDLSYTESASTSVGASKDKSACVVRHQEQEVQLRGAALVAATCPPNGFDTQGDFDLNWYSGKWYVQQQMLISYLPKEYTHCVTAQYTILDKKSILGYDIQVDNHAETVDGKVLGPITSICSKIVNEKEGKLEVSPCFLPTALAGEYWVVAFSKEEEWALVSGGPPKNVAPDGKTCRTGTGTNGSGFWIFTRKQLRDEGIVQKVRGIAASKGFDLSVLVDIDQTKCSAATLDVTV